MLAKKIKTANTTKPIFLHRFNKRLLGDGRNGEATGPIQKFITIQIKLKTVMIKYGSVYMPGKKTIDK